MQKDIFRPFLNENIDVLNFLRYNTIGKNKDKYFDFTASGLAFRQIENRVHEVLETYANTHSKESSNAKVTTHYYEQARENLAKNFELTDDFTILPSGCGSTAAIKHFQELLGLYIPPATKKRFGYKKDKKKAPLIIVGPYEHHSNELSFRESLANVKRVKLTDDGLIDLKHLKKILENNKDKEMIASFCIASNVSGIITPYKKISKILRKYNALICFDAAASSPYMNIPCKYYDAMFVSSHKLLGGPSSCGLLIIKKSLIDTSLAPTFSGGGTVKYVNKKSQIYEDKIELREDAGTPPILQLIRSSLAYQLRNEIGFEFIKQRKDELLKYLLEELKSIPNLVIYGNQEVDNIGIVSFNIKGFNPYSLCEKLSNNGNFQTRAGCSCAGPYGHDLLGLKKVSMKNRPGWLRVGVHYMQTKENIKALVDEIKSNLV
ncbi:aminotransferase class V-fold PLP-dependent enzyme [Aliarcobacter cibarius]|uniref:Aminotransferase class V-fold PLP-dependent enzyme n=1 Tax=Aliarcobacter cibarius TaxID=255507 RepID=A0ABY2V4Y6_9BACT|nr:aminotransferase class V-fold PLP-dependent enzyme [Aliarcobacter cibarius]TLT00257.1 aminotransferase class V-fold PLP-dependent enzyme [Aliarcobacter cibarius]TLT00564.1 aminotransferase class V-fold PLP-dependent enzyme [Aliarcobacter cibarius]